jgi:hypothetical protein
MRFVAYPMVWGDPIPRDRSRIPKAAPKAAGMPYSPTVKRGESGGGRSSNHEAKFS